MKNTVIAVVSVVAALAVVAAGTAGIWSAPGAEGDEASGVAEGTSETAPLAQQGGAPTPEGIVYAGEYRNSLYDPVTGMSLFWQNDAETLYVGISSPGTGWLGVGFSAQAGKPGSNIVIGAIADGTVTIQDGYGVTKKLHLADRTSSILAFGGSETQRESTLEFAIPLTSGDSQDAALAPGQAVQVILAYQATLDSFLAEHTRYSMTSVLLDR